jgi:hypothetical protein
VVYGTSGFIAPKPRARLPRSARTIVVRFRLTSASGTPIAAALAEAFAARHDVRAVLRGPGIRPARADCGWEASRRDFRCAVRVPAGVRTGTAHPYSITATEKLGSGFVTVPAVGTGAAPEIVYFR